MSILLRGQTYYLRKRVPRRFKPVEDRDHILISLHTDSKLAAETKAKNVWNDMIDAWEASMDGEAAEAKDKMAAARELAAKRGFRFMSAREVSQLPYEALMHRIESVGMGRNHRPKEIEAAAILGGGRPEFPLLSEVLEIYWTATEAENLGKSADQIRRARAPRLKAFNNFIALVGDKQINHVTRDDFHALRNWWKDKIEKQGLTRNSANKDLVHVASTLRRVALERQLDLEFSTERLMFSEKDEKTTRLPIPDAWIKDKILAPGALDGMNAQARGILLTMINTGARPSEIASLTAAQIHLGGPTPHISIEPVGRQLKTANARRKIPLVGCSLLGMTLNREGFPRYANKAGVTDAINKYLRENRLFPSPDHTLYGLRHAFEDRLLAAGVDERIRRDLMGHALTRERYGAGASLSQIAEMMQRIAIHAPTA
jgi:integrase